MFSVADTADGNERGRLRPGFRPPGLGAVAGAAAGGDTHGTRGQLGGTWQTGTEPMPKDWWSFGWCIT